MTLKDGLYFSIIEHMGIHTIGFYSILLNFELRKCKFRVPKTLGAMSFDFIFKFRNESEVLQSKLVA